MSNVFIAFITMQPSSNSDFVLLCDALFLLIFKDYEYLFKNLCLGILVINVFIYPKVPANDTSADEKNNQHDK